MKPSGASPARISDFASAIAWTLPKNSRWTGRTTVKTATSGRPSRRELAQLARRRHPHLGHHPLGAVGHVEQRQREAVEVVQVARRPAVAEAGGEDRRQQLLGGGLAGRAGDAGELLRRPPPHEAREVVQGAEGVVDLDAAAPPAGSRSVRPERSPPPAPRARASGTKRWPSVCSPREGEEHLAAADRARIDRRARRSRRRGSPADDPAADRARRVSDRQPSQSAPPGPCRSPRGRRTGVLVADRLAPARAPCRPPAPPSRAPRAAIACADRLAAVGDQAVGAVAARLQPLLDGGQDGQRVLAARVVGGGDRPGRPARRRPPHQRALAGVAVAAAAEDDRHLAAARPPRAPSAGRRRGRRRCGRSRRRPANGWPRSTGSIRPGTGRWAAKAAATASCGRPRVSASRRRGQQVRQVVAAEERRGERHARRAASTRTPRMPARRSASTSAGRDLPALAEGQGVRQLGGEPPAVGVVDVDRRPRARASAGRRAGAWPRSSPRSRGGSRGGRG